ncbi:MAG TPA: branched-chain amino acid ABC transporter permease [Candidatus Acidoferrales bacterium]|nr:branched-chain amino acid ABC transporter permease [Candidatus Acidoferrales bacterium]
MSTVSTVALLLLTGLGLGGLYFLIASGLSLIWGLMRVLNFAHGALFTLAAYIAWQVTLPLQGGNALVAWSTGLVVAVIAGGSCAFLLEVFLIRPLYARPIGQILVTVGVALAAVALVEGAYGSDPKQMTLPAWMAGSIHVLGTDVPTTRIAIAAIALVVLAALLFFLRGTRYGLVIRAGVENRAMVEALGIDVDRAFTLVFVIGGMAAGLAGFLAGTYFGYIDPVRGTSMLIFAFIVVVIGGLGSITGSAIAAAVVAVVQQFLNFYAAPGIGDFSVVILLAAALLLRPRTAEST